MGKVRRDWFEIFSASECQASAKAADLGEITASDIVRQAMAKLSTLNIDGPEAVAAATQALNDMHKAGALRVRPPVSHTVTVSTPIKGWNFKPSEGANIEGTGYLVRAKDGVLIRASGDRRVWEKQIVDFEFLEGIEWTPQQIAAITDPGHTHDIPVVQHESVSISPTSGMPTYYDVNYDERRPITQEIVDNMERGIQKLIAERDEIRSGKAPDALLVADRNARVRERDDARKEVAHWQKECTRAVGLFEERGHALRQILGDMPSPAEDPYERCRKIASDALGYQDPEPLESVGREDLLNAVAYWAGEYANRNQACERQAGVLGDAANEIARLFEVAKERNALIAALGRSGVAQADEIATLRTELMAARDTISATMAQRIDWHDAQLAARDARIADLDTRLAAFTAANVPDPPKPDPIANAIRPRETDRRRIGG